MRFVPPRSFFRLGAPAMLLSAAAAFLPALQAADAEPTLGSILARKNRETFDAVATYVADHESAADAERAYLWLFAMARREGWESDALPVVERYARRAETDATVKGIAQQVQAIGLARQGKAEPALDAFDEAIAGVGLRAANDTLDLATSLATALQTGGKPGSAAEPYNRLTRKFFLNAGVRQFCENRLGKLELLGKDAPDISVEDVDGKGVSLGDLRGKLVLIDFWATNCPPCLEEFPSLKQLHADYHKDGFEVIGISLDEERSVVDAFQAKARLPWRLALSKTDRDATRERFRVVTIPSMFLVDAAGRIQYVDVRGEELRRVVERTLKPAP